jgi:hypothetical protein
VARLFMNHSSKNNTAARRGDRDAAKLRDRVVAEANGGAAL